MNEKNWKRFLQNEMDKELQEIESILEEMDNDPNMKDVVAPEEVHEKLFAQIREEQNARELLSEEDKELIRLGKIYKKKRKWNKYLILAAAVVCAMAFGVTSMGGPIKVIEKVQGIMESRERINTDTEDKRIEGVEIASEVEAYQKIEDEFGFYPVELVHLPNGIKFKEISMDKTMQLINLFYQGAKQDSISYTMYLNYRTGSIGRDVEDTLLETYDKVIDGNEINIKRYLVEAEPIERYIVSYEYQNVYYFLEINNIESQEVELIIEKILFN